MSQPNHLQRTRLAVALIGVFAGDAALAQLSVPPPPITSYTGDPGTLGNPSSWRTPEFLRDWGLQSISADHAYAAGYAGKTMSIGVVDSGFLFMQVEHDNRFFSVVNEGGTTGPTPGFYNQAYNNSHGTHVSGTVGAEREGLGLAGTPGSPDVRNMHGVAFNADVYNVNTHKTDGVYYGVRPANANDASKLDNAYVGNAYRTLANMRDASGGKLIPLITSSWGSQPPTENYNTLDPLPGQPATFGIRPAFRYLITPNGQPDSEGNLDHWIHGALEAARGGTVIQFTAGNSGYNNPTARATAPYFLPDLEPTFYTTSSISLTARTFDAQGNVIVPGTQLHNRCGVVKWSCVTAPGNAINSTTVGMQAGVPVATYGSSSGTSMAGPHSAASLLLIMQRFPYLTGEQALYTMKTTARQNATLSNPANPATTIPNPNAGKMVQVPDVRNGWGTVNLRDAFQGPGQFVGRFAVDTKGYSDVWSNDISDVAIRTRKQEDATEAQQWAAEKAANGWTRGLPATATAQQRFNYETGVRREQARNTRIYAGSLTKSGAGTLFLTGNNTYTGSTTVVGGKLSINGVQNSPVIVNGNATVGGSGFIQSSLQALNGGIVAPGLSQAESDYITAEDVPPGNTLTAQAVKIAPGGAFAAMVSGGTATRLVASGPTALGGTLFMTVGDAPIPGMTYTIMEAGAPIVGTFAGLPEASTFMAGGHQFRISYMNNRVTVTASGPLTL